MIDLFSGSLKFMKEAFPPKPKFSPDDIPDLTGKVAIVTGANSGVGKEIAKELLKKNAKVYAACRSRSNAEEAIAGLKQETGKEAIFLELDLANLKKIKQAAELYASNEKQLHILVNNAGVMWTPLDSLTSDGYDLQFGTNVLGHFYFTKLLMPILTETARNGPEEQVRIVSEASIMRHFVHTIKFDTLLPGKPRTRAGSNELYCQSKFAVAVLAKEFARRYAADGIVSIGCAPGIIKTNLLRHTNFFLSFLIDKLYMYKPYYGMLTPLCAAALPEARELNGAFLLPWARIGSAGRGTDDTGLGEELWNWLEEQVENVE